MRINIRLRLAFHLLRRALKLFQRRVTAARLNDGFASGAHHLKAHVTLAARFFFRQVRRQPVGYLAGNIRNVLALNALALSGTRQAHTRINAGFAFEQAHLFHTAPKCAVNVRQQFHLVGNVVHEVELAVFRVLPETVHIQFQTRRILRHAQRIPHMFRPHAYLVLILRLGRDCRARSVRHRSKEGILNFAHAIQRPNIRKRPLGNVCQAAVVD